MDWTVIESRQNPAIKRCASLGEKKARDREGVFIAEGSTIFFDLAKLGVRPDALFLSSDKAELKKRVETCLGKEQVKAYLLSPFVFEKITTEKGSEGIVSLYRKDAVFSALPFPDKGRFVALEEVQDPGNVGTVLRTAAALGFDGVLTVGGADPFGVKSIRSSMGAFALIPVKSFPTTEEAFSFLTERGVFSVAATLASDSLPITDLSFPSSVCVWIGNEGNGLSDTAVALSDRKSIIPISRTESLNAAMAAGIFMWEIAKGGKKNER